MDLLFISTFMCPLLSLGLFFRVSCGRDIPNFFHSQAGFFIRIEHSYEKEILIWSILKKGRLKQRENKWSQSTEHIERPGILRWTKKLNDRLQQPSIKHHQDNSPSQAEPAWGEREAPLSQVCQTASLTSVPAFSASRSQSGSGDGFALIAGSR